MLILPLITSDVRDKKKFAATYDGVETWGCSVGAEDGMVAVL